MEEKKNYEKIIKLNAQIKKLREKIYPLRKGAVLELYSMGYSMDSVCAMLSIAKVDVSEILHKHGIKIRNIGRRKWKE